MQHNGFLSGLPHLIAILLLFNKTQESSGFVVSPFDCHQLREIILIEKLHHSFHVIKTKSKNLKKIMCVIVLKKEGAYEELF